MNNTYPKYIQKYLHKFFNPKWNIEGSIDSDTELIIVIPALAEYERLPFTIDSLIKTENSLHSKTAVLVVLNNAADADKTVMDNNTICYQWYRALVDKNTNTIDEITRRAIESELQFAVIDAFSEEYSITENAGVGMARKIGADLAVTAFDYSAVKKTIIAYLDADCIVAENYITSLFEVYRSNRNPQVVVNHFEHCITNEDDYPILMYEIFLRYYTLGLVYAKSPYAFDTVGSTITFTTEAYVKAGGMNKKPAGEDFYFLEKLSKRDCIYLNTKTIVHPSSRVSNRVPFGTGRSMMEFNDKRRSFDTLYNPEVFEVVKKWLDVFENHDSDDSSKIVEEASGISESLKSFLVRQNFPKAWMNIYNNSKTKDQRSAQKKMWFDAFRTMKLIHFLRETDYPNIEYNSALMRLYRMLGKPFPVREDSSDFSFQEYYSVLKSMRKLHKFFAKYSL